MIFSPDSKSRVKKKKTFIIIQINPFSKILQKYSDVEHLCFISTTIQKTSIRNSVLSHIRYKTKKCNRIVETTHWVSIFYLDIVILYFSESNSWSFLYSRWCGAGAMVLFVVPVNPPFVVDHINDRRLVLPPWLDLPVVFSWLILILRKRKKLNRWDWHNCNGHYM